MVDENDDDFMEIINHSELEEYLSNSDTQVMTMLDLHAGLKAMGESIMYITSFIDEFYTACAADDDDGRPGLSVESVVFLRNIFENAMEFNSTVIMYEEDDEDEDDEDDE